jgi:hypothetical protein
MEDMAATQIKALQNTVPLTDAAEVRGLLNGLGNSPPAGMKAEQLASRKFTTCIYEERLKQLGGTSPPKDPAVAQERLARCDGQAPDLGQQMAACNAMIAANESLDIAHAIYASAIASCRTTTTQSPNAAAPST